MPNSIIVSPGDRFSRLTVLREAETQKKHRRFECLCECGMVTVTPLSNLRNGTAKSCGCWQKQVVSQASRKHGAYLTREYGIWESMLARCYNKNNSNWKFYGGRGITVCAQWREDFTRFLADVGKSPTCQHTIDRYPDQNGNYEPGNVRWATMKEQSRNTRRNQWAMHNGERRLVIEVCEEIGLHPGTVRTRRINGWPEKYWFIPLRTGRKLNAGDIQRDEK